MKREKVTYDEVASACEAVLERGDQPSVRNVLQEVGGGGSQTIAAHLTAWRQMRAASEEAQQAITSQHISGDFVQGLLQEIARHKDQAVEGVKRQLAAAEEDLQSLREELAKAHDEIEQTQRQLEQAERDLGGARQQMSTEVATQTALLGESQKQVAKLTHDLESLSGDLARERVAAAEMRIAVDTAQSRQDEWMRTAERAEEAQTQWLAEQKTMQKSVADMQYAVFEAEKKAAVASEQVLGRDAALLKLEEAIQTALQERRSAVERHQVTSEKLETAVRRADIAEAKLHASTQTQRVGSKNTDAVEGGGASAN